MKWKAIRHVKRQGGTLERISVAVVINEAGRPTTSLNTEEAGAASNQVGYSDEDIQRFTNLVKGVVGFKEDRGDIITGRTLRQRNSEQAEGWIQEMVADTRERALRHGEAVADHGRAAREAEAAARKRSRRKTRCAG